MMSSKFLICLILLIPVTVRAQGYISGVSTEAISMPSLPGSVEGLPHSINDSTSKGQFVFGVEINVPKGINNHTPYLNVIYNSSNGQSEFGLGWSLNLQNISVNTKRGVPSYTSSDSFWGPDGELVKIERTSSSNQFFAPYINKNQNLYEYDESNKTWIIHQADGKKLYFGSSMTSKVTSSSDQTYKWFVEKITDSVGNNIRFEYTKTQGYPYLSSVKYAYKNSEAHYRVDFSYEERDDVIESYKSTFLVGQTKRCIEIAVKSGTGHIIRSYEFVYQNQTWQKGSFLKEIRQHGEGGDDLNPPMPPIIFSYSEIDLEQSIQTTQINFADSQIFPPSLNNSRTTVVDINRDSFPDVLETSRYGAKVWLNDGNSGFESHYKIPEFVSILGTGQTKILDVDGDRIADFVATGLYPQYFKGGISVSPGHLGFTASPSPILSIPRYSIGAANVKTVDINADGRLDIIAREVDNFKSFISTSDGNWSRIQDFIVNTGAFDLSSPYTFFSDMNGDGLMDLVFVRPTTLIYLPNMGTGVFANPVPMNFEEISPLILKLFKQGKYNFVIDVNNDGYSDLISASESTVALSLNMGNGNFSETLHLTDIHKDRYNLKGLHITTADINGNNTTDILWTNDFNDWRYLDFSDGKLNLMTMLDNGLGLKTHIEYEFATRFGSHAESSETVLPYPILVMKSIYETLGSGLEVIRKDNYKYFGGYYNAFDNDYRGFSLVEKIEEGDSSIGYLYSKIFYEQGRLESKDHQQLMILKKSDYVYNYNQETVGDLLKEESHSLTTLLTFEGLEDKKSAIPFVSETIFTEGDEDNITTNRQHKIVRQIDLSESGFIEKDRKITYIDLSQILRKEEQTLAINNIDTSHIANRVCEKKTYDSSDNLLRSERFYYDSENICSLTQGLMTSRDAWTGSEFETKNTYTYKSFGSLATFSDSLSHITTIAYDSFDIHPIAVTNAAGHIRMATFSADTGVITSITDENNLTTSIYYDLYLRVEKIVGPGDSLSHPTLEGIYTFGSSSGTFSSIITKKREKSGQPGTFDIKEYFDGKGRSLAKISEGSTEKFILEASTYNKRGEKHFNYQKSFVSDFNFPIPMSNARYFETHYDSLKRSILIFNPEHTVSEPSYKENYYLVGETISYDEERKVSYVYKDALGRRVGHKNALEQEVFYDFNPLDQIIKITDPHNAETLFGYDSQGRRVCKVDPTVGLNLYTYNSENLVTLKTMYGFVNGHTSCAPPLGITPRSVSFEYNDSLNRITKMDFPAGSNTEDVSYHYDELTSSYPKGRLTSVSFGIGSKTFDFDIYGNQHKSTLNIGVSSYSTEKKFDVLGRVEEIIYPAVGVNSLAVKYDFDEGSNLLSVKDSLTNFLFAQNMSYSPLGQLALVDYGNNTKSTMSYDNTDQSYKLVNILTEKIGTPNTILQNIDYEYDKVSNVVERNDQKNSFIETYSFDDLYRIVSADLGGTIKTWAFDEIGNITSNNGQTYAYAPERKQIVSSVGSSIYTFDTFGNISRDADRTYVFDWNNRLRSVTKSLQTTTYDYGEDGLRITKTTPNQTTVFIDKYTELRGSDVVRHIYANNKLIASIDDLNNISYNHSDHLGSSNLKTDAMGNVVKRIEYAPFGSKRTEIGAYDNIKNRFTGQYEDEETSLYYYQQRYYDPVLSRFITADPLYLEEMNMRGTDSQELNLYAYVRNNPIKFVDPTGNLVEVFSRSVVGTKDSGRHLFIKISDQPYGVSDRIISLDGRPFGGTPNVNTIDGFENDRASLRDGTYKDVQVVTPPEGISQNVFEQKIIDFAQSYNVNAIDNKYPMFGGALQDNVRNSNTFVDDAVESAGGILKNFEKAIHQNTGDFNGGTFIDSSGAAYESTK